MGAALVAMGNRLRRWLRVPLAPGLALAADCALGAGSLGTVVLLPLLLGWVHGAVLASIPVAFALVGRWRWVRGGVRRSLPVVPLAALLPLALAPPVLFYDALTYHLGLPWQVIQEGVLAPHPENVFAAFPPLAQVLYLGPLTWGLDRVPALLHLGSFGAIMVGSAALARSLGASRGLALLAAVCVPVLPVLTVVPALPAAEGWCLVAVLPAAALVLGRSRPGFPALAGLLAGIALAARMQGLVWLGVLLTVDLVRRRHPRDTVCALLGAVAGSTPWWLKNWILLGDPLAPLGWNREGMEILWRDGRVPLHTSAPSMAWVVDAAHQLLPHAAYLGPLVLAAALAVYLRRRVSHVVAAGIILASVPGWYVTGSQARFLAPTVVLVLSLAAASAGTAAGRLAAALSLGITVTLGAALSTRKVVDLWVPGLPVVTAASLPPHLVINNPFPAYGAMASRAGEVARALVVGDPRGYGIPFPFRVTSQCDVSPLREIVDRAHGPEDVAAWLAEQGFSHLVVNHGELVRLQDAYPVAPFRTATGERMWRAFLAMSEPALAGAGEVMLYRVPGPGRGAD